LPQRFSGEFEMMLDDKNRLPIPAAIRKLLDPEIDGKAFYLVFIREWPWLYPMKYYDKLASQIEMSLEPTDEEIEYMHRRFSMASIVEWDGQGRILIPESTLKRCENLGREITLVGSYDKLEIWNRQAWKDRWTSLIKNPKPPVAKDIAPKDVAQA
jgi:MraZ protein